MASTRSTSSTSGSGVIPATPRTAAGAAAVAVAIADVVAVQVADGAVQPVPRPPPIKGGGSAIERLNCRSNFIRLVHTCITVGCQVFDDHWRTVLPELAAVAAVHVVLPSDVHVQQLADKVILVPCTAWFRNSVDIVSREPTIITFDEAYVPLCNADGRMPMALLDKVGFYVFHIKTVGTLILDHPSHVKVSAVYIDTLPPFIVDPALPLCVGNDLLVSGMMIEMSLPIDEGFLLKAKEELTQQYILDNFITLGKRVAEAVPLLSRAASGYIQSTNDGKLIQRFSKDLHDKQLQLTHGFIRLLWSTPVKLDELFGDLDHRWDIDRIRKAVSSAYCSLVRDPHWSAITYYARIRELRVMKDDKLLEVALCFKASAVDHRILGAGDFLPSSIIPDFSTNDHTLLFTSFANFGMVLAVHIHDGYLNVLLETEQLICNDEEIAVLPDYVLQMVFVLMLDSVGKEINLLTVESGSSLWSTDKLKGVMMIKDAAKNHFTRARCVKVFDQWDHHYKGRHVAWGSASAKSTSSDSHVKDTKDPKGLPPKKDLTITRNSFCIRDVKFYYGYEQSGHPASACTVSACSGRHIVSSSPPKKDSVIQWLKDDGAQGGKVAAWKFALADFIQKKK